MLAQAVEAARAAITTLLSAKFETRVILEGQAKEFVADFLRREGCVLKISNSSLMEICAKMVISEMQANQE